MFLAACVATIALSYGVPQEAVEAVSWVESRWENPGRVGPNSNGTYDLGIMQINTWWLKKSNPANIAQYGITEHELLTNDCTNIAVGTWILAQNYSRYGNWAGALSAYNTGKARSPIGRRYAYRVIKKWREIHDTRQQSIRTRASNEQFQGRPESRVEIATAQ